MLIRLLSTFRHLLQPFPLALLLAQILLLTRLRAHRPLKERVIQIHQVLLLRSAGGIAHPLQILRVRIHLDLELRTHSDLILQDRRSRHALTHQVPAAHTLLQHHEPYHVLLLEYQRQTHPAILHFFHKKRV